MSKKRKIDFILKEENDERLIFRFYPRQSSCHSFGDKPPKSWSNVYKVYYSYAVIQQWKDDPEDQWYSEKVFYEHCDECSIIDAVGKRCLLLADGIETLRHGTEMKLLNTPIFPFGMGTEWTISKKCIPVCHDHDDEEKLCHTYYKFTLFDWFNKGYRFSIQADKLKPFGEYLINCCEYMLAHGDPI